MGIVHTISIVVMSKAELPIQDLRRIWNRCDYNGNGVLSRAEFDKMVMEEWPDFSNKPAINLAHHIAAGRDGLVDKKEFKRLLYCLDWCNDLWAAFDEIDNDDDRRVDEDEFIKGANEVLSLGLPEEQLRSTFNEI